MPKLNGTDGLTSGTLLSILGTASTTGSSSCIWEAESRMTAYIFARCPSKDRELGDCLGFVLSPAQQPSDDKGYGRPPIQRLIPQARSR